MARHWLRLGVALALSSSTAGDAIAGDEQACGKRFDRVQAAVTSTLDWEEVPFVTVMRRLPGCVPSPTDDCLVPRLATPPCGGEATSFCIRSVARASGIYIERRWPTAYPVDDTGDCVDDEVEDPAYDRRYTLLTSVEPAPLQDEADAPNTVVGVSVQTTATLCTDGSFDVVSGTGTDVPSDVGEAAESNPNVDEFGGDHFMNILHLDCEVDEAP